MSKLGYVGLVCAALCGIRCDARVRTAAAPAPAQRVESTDCASLQGRDPRAIARLVARLRDDLLAACRGVAPTAADAVWGDLEGLALDTLARVATSRNLHFAADETFAMPMLQWSIAGELVAYSHIVELGACRAWLPLQRADCPELFETMELLWSELGGAPSVCPPHAARLVAPAVLALGQVPAGSIVPWSLLVIGGEHAPQVTAPAWFGQVVVRRLPGGTPGRWLLSGDAMLPKPGARRASTLLVDATEVPVTMATEHALCADQSVLAIAARDGVWLGAVDFAWRDGASRDLPRASLVDVAPDVRTKLSVLRNGEDRLRVLVQFAAGPQPTGRAARLCLQIPGEESAMELPVAGLR